MTLISSHSTTPSLSHACSDAPSGCSRPVTAPTHHAACSSGSSMPAGGQVSVAKRASSASASASASTSASASASASPSAASSPSSPPSALAS
eukprot:scaffold27073_cov62-Phaeocystis_antarctica.AAC.3